MEKLKMYDSNLYQYIWNNVYYPIYKRNINYELITTNIYSATFEAHSIVAIFQYLITEAYINGRKLMVNDREYVEKKLEKIGSIDIGLSIFSSIIQDSDALCNRYMDIAKNAIRTVDENDEMELIELNTETMYGKFKCSYDYSTKDVKICDVDNNTTYTFHTIFDEYSFEEYKNMLITTYILEKSVEVGVVNSTTSIDDPVLLANRMSPDNKLNSIIPYIDSIKQKVLSEDESIYYKEYNDSKENKEYYGNAIKISIRAMTAKMGDKLIEDFLDYIAENSPSSEVNGIVTNDLIDSIENFDIVLDGKHVEHIKVPDDIRKDIDTIGDYYRKKYADNDHTRFSIGAYSSNRVYANDRSTGRPVLVANIQSIIANKVDIKDDESYISTPYRLSEIDIPVRTEGTRIREWYKSELIKRGLNEKAFDYMESATIHSIKADRNNDGSYDTDPYEEEYDDEDIKDIQNYLGMSAAKVLGYIDDDEDGEGIILPSHDGGPKGIIDSISNINDLESGGYVGSAKYVSNDDNSDIITEEDGEITESVGNNYVKSLDILSNEIYNKYICKQLKNWMPVGKEYPFSNIEFTVDLSKAIERFIDTSYYDLKKNTKPSYDIKPNTTAFVITLFDNKKPIIQSYIEYDNKQGWSTGLFSSPGPMLTNIYNKDIKEDVGTWFMISSKFGYIAERLNFLNIPRKSLYGSVLYPDLLKHIMSAFRLAINYRLIYSKNLINNNPRMNIVDRDYLIEGNGFIIPKYNFDKILKAFESMYQMYIDRHESDDSMPIVFAKDLDKIYDFYSRSAKSNIIRKPRKIHVNKSKMAIHFPGNSNNGIRDIVITLNDRMLIDNINHIHDDKSFYITVCDRLFFKIEDASNIPDQEILGNVTKILKYVDYEYNNQLEDDNE